MGMNPYAPPAESPTADLVTQSPQRTWPHHGLHAGLVCALVGLFVAATLDNQWPAVALVGALLFVVGSCLVLLTAHLIVADAAPE